VRDSAFFVLTTPPSTVALLAELVEAAKSQAQKVANLEEQLKATESGINGLAQQVVAAQSKGQRATELEKQLAAAQSKWEQLEQQLTAARIERNELKELLTAAERDNTELAEELSAAQNNGTELLQQLADAHSKRNELKQQLEASQSDKAELLKQLAAAKRKVIMGTWSTFLLLAMGLIFVATQQHLAPPSQASVSQMIPKTPRMHPWALYRLAYAHSKPELLLQVATQLPAHTAAQHIVEQVQQTLAAAAAIAGAPSEATAELTPLASKAVDRLMAELTAGLAIKLHTRHTSSILDAPAPTAPPVLNVNTTCTWQEAPASTAAITAAAAAAPAPAQQCGLMPSFLMQQCGTERASEHDACDCSSGNSPLPGLLVHRVAVKLAPVETAVRQQMGSVTSQWAAGVKVSKTGLRKLSVAACCFVTMHNINMLLCLLAKASAQGLSQLSAQCVCHQSCTAACRLAAQAPLAQE
jgi:hypothetical protein